MIGTEILRHCVSCETLRVESWLACHHASYRVLGILSAWNPFPSSESGCRCQSPFPQNPFRCQLLRSDRSILCAIPLSVCGQGRSTGWSRDAVVPSIWVGPVSATAGCVPSSMYCCISSSVVARGFAATRSAQLALPNSLGHVSCWWSYWRQRWQRGIVQPRQMYCTLPGIITKLS